MICNRNEILVAPSEFGPVSLDIRNRESGLTIYKTKNLSLFQKVFPRIQVFGFAFGMVIESKNDYLNSRGRHGLRIVKCSSAHGRKFGCCTIMITI